MARSYSTRPHSFRYSAISLGTVHRSSISNRHCPLYQAALRIQDLLLGTRFKNSRFPGVHSKGAASSNIHPLTSEGRPGAGLQGWMEHCPPVTRRPLSECLHKKRGSRLGEKVFVLKFTE